MSFDDVFIRRESVLQACVSFRDDRTEFSLSNDMFLCMIRNRCCLIMVEKVVKNRRRFVITTLVGDGDGREAEKDCPPIRSLTSKSADCTNQASCELGYRVGEFVKGKTTKRCANHIRLLTNCLLSCADHAHEGKSPVTAPRKPQRCKPIRATLSQDQSRRRSLQRYL